MVDVDWPGTDTSYNLYIQLRSLVTLHDNFGRNHNYLGFTQLLFNSLISVRNVEPINVIRELVDLNGHLSDPLLEQLTKDYVTEQM